MISDVGTTPTASNKLVDADGVPGDAFGTVVAIDGDIVAIGAPSSHAGGGSAFVLQRSGTSWSLADKLTYSGKAAQAELGASAGVSGTTAVFGYPGETGGGAAVVVGAGASGWVVEASLSATSTVAFGASAAIDGGTIVVGDPGTTAPGAAYVFVQSGTAWSQEAQLVNAAGAEGDEFGSSVAIHGDTIVVGALAESSSTGAAYLFARTGTSWAPQARVTAPDAEPLDCFAYSVGLNGDALIVGAPNREGLTGGAYTFQRIGTAWSVQATLVALDGSPDDFFGNGVAIAGSIALVGAPGVPLSPRLTNGAVYVFTAASANGDACTADSDCATSHCTDGVCCGVTACGACATCGGATPGLCTPLSIGSTPKSNCGAYVCDGSTVDCPSACSGDGECAPGSRCDATSRCVSGSRCTGDRSGVYDASGNVVSCGAYLCGDDGTCPTSCTTSVDCQGGYVCASVSGASECVAVVGTASARGGCTFGEGSHDSSPSLLGAGALAAVVFARRRRNARALRRRVVGAACLAAAASISTRATAAPNVIGGQVAEITTTTIPHLGSAVGYDGTTILATSPPAANGVGVAYFYAAAGTTWTQSAALVGSTAKAGDDGGEAVALADGTALVGSFNARAGAGEVYVYTRGGTGWDQTATLVSPAPAPSEAFGESLAMSGITAVVGADGASSQAGAAYVFVFEGDAWELQATLTTPGTMLFGASAAIDVDTIVVGSPLDNGQSGRAFVFVRDGTAWTLQATLTPSDGAPGAWFGSAVAVSGDTVVVGAFLAQSLDGAAYVFDRTGSSWSQTQELHPPPADTEGRFGSQVALESSDLIIGAPYARLGAGVAYSYERPAGSDAWALSEMITAIDAAPGSQFAGALALSGRSLVVGAPTASQPGAPQAGAVYLFSPAPGYGSPCTQPTDCASDFCADGVCCTVADCGTCATCAGPAAGTCAPMPLGATPKTTCGEYACDGSSEACPDTCAGNKACLGGAHCNEVVGVCVDGAYCSADLTSSIDATGASTSCGGYLCSPAGTCATSCATSTECAGGYVCASSNGALSCIAPTPTSGGGCAIGGRANVASLGLAIVAIAIGLARARRRS